MSIIVQDLHHVYNPGTPLETPSLRGVSFTIEEGEFVGLIGTMGSGKSTLVQHINGLIQPPAGTVIVDGIDVGAAGSRARRGLSGGRFRSGRAGSDGSDMERAAGRRAPAARSRSDDLLTVRQRVGLVFQYPEHQLFAETVAADVAFGPRNLGLSDEEVAGRVREALARVRLPYDEFKDRSPFSLSGGQQRRVALAGVLAMKPRYLVLDEPTAGLDPRGRRELLDLITALHREHGVAVVLVTHLMEDVARLADKVIALSGGRIAMSGPPGEVLSAERAEALRELGLDVPAAARLIAALRARGWTLPDGLVTEDAVVQAVLQALHDQGKRADPTPIQRSRVPTGIQPASGSGPGPEPTDGIESGARLDVGPAGPEPMTTSRAGAKLGAEATDRIKAGAWPESENGDEPGIPRWECDQDVS